jgi:hypothetical protein
MRCSHAARECSQRRAKKPGAKRRRDGGSTKGPAAALEGGNGGLGGHSNNNVIQTNRPIRARSVERGGDRGSGACSPKTPGPISLPSLLRDPRVSLAQRGRHAYYATGWVVQRSGARPRASALTAPQKGEGEPRSPGHKRRDARELDALGKPTAPETDVCCPSGQGRGGGWGRRGPGMLTHATGARRRKGERPRRRAAEAVAPAWVVGGFDKQW